jgi:hypothetical protein
MNNYSGITLSHVCSELKQDREIILASVRRNGDELQNVPEHFKRDREVVMPRYIRVVNLCAMLPKNSEMIWI